MKSKLTFFIVILSILAVSIVAIASEQQLKGAHKEMELACADCHGTDAPVKRAKTSVCKTCHEDHEGEEKVYLNNGAEVEVNVHKSHQGELRCTLCHNIHKPSKLYCNQDGCHAFDDDMNVK